MPKTGLPFTLRLPFAMVDRHLRLEQVLAAEASRSWAQCLPLLACFALSRPEEFPKGPPQTFETPIKGLWLISAYSGGGGFTGAISSGAGAVRAVLRERDGS